MGDYFMNEIKNLNQTQIEISNTLNFFISQLEKGKINNKAVITNVGICDICNLFMDMPNDNSKIFYFLEELMYNKMVIIYRPVEGCLIWIESVECENLKNKLIIINNN